MDIEFIDLECGAQIQVETHDKNENYYKITVVDIDEKVILNRRDITKNEWNKCKGYYAYKLDILLDSDKSTTLTEPYIMFEMNYTMYKMTDLDYKSNHRSLLRSCEPIGINVEEPDTIDLMTFGGLHSIFTYKKDWLVFRFDNFYYNGDIIGTLEEAQKETGLSKTYIEYLDDRVKDYFENKLLFKYHNKIKFAGFKSEFGDAEYDDYNGLLKKGSK